MNLKKGFTLIELLVVVAIIGILASVVLASLNTARSKGSDAAIKANLTNTRAQAALFYDGTSPSTYAAVCTTATTGIGAGVAAAAAASGTTVVTDGSLQTTSTTNCFSTVFIVKFIFPAFLFNTALFLVAIKEHQLHFSPPVFVKLWLLMQSVD